LKLQQPLDPRRESNEWIYQTGDELKVFDTKEIAQAWFAKNDPEGVAFRLRGDRRACSGSRAPADSLLETGIFANLAGDFSAISPSASQG
jgi:hypothetical protein